MFIWQTEPTWFRPSSQHDRITVRSSACSAMLLYQSDTQWSLAPYCFQVRLEGINVLLAVPIAVILNSAVRV